MIGHAPFLGQVRLVPRAGYRLGQPAPPPDQPPREGCTEIGVQTQWSLSLQSDLQTKVDQAKASGLQIVFVPTGSIFAEGSKSEQEEQVIWACPPLYPMICKPGEKCGPGQTGALPEQAPGTPEPPMAPEGTPSAFPTTLAVGGGVAAAALVAFLVFR